MKFGWRKRMAVLVHLRKEKSKRVSWIKLLTGMGVVLYFIMHTTTSQLPCTFFPIARYLIQPLVYTSLSLTLPSFYHVSTVDWPNPFILSFLFFLLPFFFPFPLFIFPFHWPFLFDCACLDKLPVLGRVVYLFSFWLVCPHELQPSGMATLDFFFPPPL